MPYRTERGTHYHMTRGCCGAKISCGTKGLAPCSICCGGTARGGGAAGVTQAGTGGAGAGRIEDGSVVRWKAEHAQPGDEGRLMVASEPLHKEDGGNGSVYVRDLESDLPYPPRMLTLIDYLELSAAADPRERLGAMAADRLAEATGNGGAPAGATGMPDHEVSAEEVEGHLRRYGYLDAGSAPGAAPCPRPMDAESVLWNELLTTRSPEAIRGYARLTEGTAVSGRLLAIADEAERMYDADMCRLLAGDAERHEAEARDPSRSASSARYHRRRAEELRGRAEELDAKWEGRDIDDGAMSLLVGAGKAKRQFLRDFRRPWGDGIAESDEQGYRFVCDEVLPAIREATGCDIRYLLWMYDTPGDAAYAADEYDYAGDIAEYPVGVPVSGYDDGGSTLYGYEEIPERNRTFWFEAGYGDDL